MRRLLAVLMLPACLSMAADTPSTDQLIQAILEGKDSGNALTEEVVDRTMGPLLDAIEANPPEDFSQRRELDQLLTRYIAELRLRLIRVGLTKIDRQLLDDYALQNPDQIMRLLAAPLDDRLLAIKELPLTRDSAVGMLLVALIEDDELTVVELAIKRARDLRDNVVARNLTSKLEFWLDLVEDQSYSPEESIYRLLFLNYANQAAETLRHCTYPPSAAQLRRGLRMQMDRVLPMGYQNLAAYALALGAARDEASADLLMELLRDEEIVWNRRLRLPAEGEVEPEKPSKAVLVTQYNADAALLALLQIYALNSEGLGMVSIDEKDWGMAGFLSQRASRQAIGAFEAWHRANAEQPVERREPFSKYIPNGNR